MSHKCKHVWDQIQQLSCLNKFICVLSEHVRVSFSFLTFDLHVAILKVRVEMVRHATSVMNSELPFRLRSDSDRDEILAFIGFWEGVWMKVWCYHRWKRKEPRTLVCLMSDVLMWADVPRDYEKHEVDFRGHTGSYRFFIWWNVHWRNKTTDDMKRLIVLMWHLESLVLWSSRSIETNIIHDSVQGCNSLFLSLISWSF